MGKTKRKFAVSIKLLYKIPYFKKNVAEKFGELKSNKYFCIIIV